MFSWPEISEPELIARLALDDLQFAAFIRDLAVSIPSRPCGAAELAQALGYPWERPRGSYRLCDGEIEALEDLEARDAAIGRFTDPAAGRTPLIAIGSNGSPEALERKFAHFPDAEDRTVLVLAGRLHGFDVGVAPQPAFYGALPATLFPSPGAAVRAAVLWVTPAQFTQLAWSELSYWLGSLRTRFDADDGAASFDEVLVFVSRFGAFCPGGEPVALGAIPAEGRSAAALSQEQLLAAAAALALGPGAKAEAMVEAVFADMAGLVERLAGTTHRAARPFASELWTPFPSAPPA